VLWNARYVAGRILVVVVVHGFLEVGRVQVRKFPLSWHTRRGKLSLRSQSQPARPTGERHSREHHPSPCLRDPVFVDLAIDVDRTTRLIPRGRPIDPDSARWPELADWLERRPTVFVDAGTGPPPPALVGDDVRSLLVTRACYVGLQRAAATRCRPDGVVLLCESGRTLRPADVEHCVGAPVVATVSVDVAVSRAVDAGLLTARLPRLLQRELKGAA